MNESCGIVRDLLPLYAENMCSPESRAAVEAHLPGCAGCQAALESIRKDAPIAPVDTLPFRALSHKLRRSRWRMAAFMTAVVLMRAIGTLYHVTAPVRPVPRPGTAEMAATARDRLWRHRHRQRVITSPTTHRPRYITYFNVKPGGEETTSYISVPEGAVPSVYYVYPNEEAVLLLGEPDPEGTFLVLTRIAPLYYNLLLMMGLLALIGALAIALRKKSGARKVLEKLIFIPVAYLTAHLFIKGGSTTSWDLIRDLYYYWPSWCLISQVVAGPRPGRRDTL